MKSKSEVLTMVLVAVMGGTLGGIAATVLMAGVVTEIEGQLTLIGSKSLITIGVTVGIVAVILVGIPITALTRPPENEEGKKDVPSG